MSKQLQIHKLSVAQLVTCLTSWLKMAWIRCRCVASAMDLVRQQKRLLSSNFDCRCTCLWVGREICAQLFTSLAVGSHWCARSGWSLVWWQAKRWSASSRRCALCSGDPYQWRFVLGWRGYNWYVSFFKSKPDLKNRLSRYFVANGRLGLFSEWRFWPTSVLRMFILYFRESLLQWGGSLVLHRLNQHHSVCLCRMCFTWR